MVDLTQREAALVRAFERHPRGTVIATESLMQIAWGPAWLGCRRWKRNLHTYVHFLRRKFGHDVIETVGKGTGSAGYRWHGWRQEWQEAGWTRQRVTS